MTESEQQTQSRGIAIVANDRVARWLLPFLESYRQTNAATPIYLIPYDDNLELTRRAADVYGVHFVPDHMPELDALAEAIYPLFPGYRRRLRKLQALALPLDEVVYIDVDTLLFRDLTPVFGLLQPGVRDFIIASTSEEYVYNKKRENHDFLRNAILFNDGFFVTSRSILSLDDFYRIIKDDEKLFHSVRKRGMLFAQPVVNFVVHRLGLKIDDLRNCVPNASSESFYKAEGISFAEDGPRDISGNQIYFAHWAGAITTPKNRPFDAAWLNYSERAHKRMKL